MPPERHYFDHNSTTPLAPEVLEALTRAYRDVYGNASSVHAAGQSARQHLESARRVVAGSMKAAPDELVFTSSGTESNNLAILGAVRQSSVKNKHVITTAIEHPAVLEPCRQLEREGVAVSYVRPDASGIIDPDEIRRLLRPETVLLSVMHANNEVGTIQPLKEIAALAREHDILMHADGVQAFAKIAVDVQQLRADFYSVSAHKLYGPKGISALYVRKGTPLRGIQYGGSHERERRAGTENVPGAMAFAEAVQLPAKEREVAELRDHFERRILSASDGVSINGNTARRLPNTSNLLFDGVSGEAMVISLDIKGMAVSSGSACSSGSVEPSHVLLAMGLTPDQARSSVRFSFGRYNTFAEVELLIEAVISSFQQLRGRMTKREHHLVHA